MTYPSQSVLVLLVGQECEANLIRNGGKVIARQNNNPGGWEGATPGIIPAYLIDSECLSLGRMTGAGIYTPNWHKHDTKPMHASILDM